jgi:Tol biopolymer transport system component
MTPERWQQVERLYHAALERKASQRAAFLREACPGDDALRGEVESLLAQENGASVLEKPAIEVAAKALGGDGGPSLPGRQIGGYQVLSLLGAGGMGEVYEARDVKLGRKVAIKILPGSFANDAERLARFEREARMLAALNHPNIATIYRLEQSGGVNYLVMELVPGQTLAERIGKGALPIAETLKIAGQIAEALEAAHEKGVIHRDLKPANVKVTPEGRVKVLDFGLAKAFIGDGSQDLSQAPTLSEEGRILGTPAYMSPEQARGLPVDKRTDIWAFGCVLYEMLTGHKPFAGPTLSDILAAILKHEPDWNALPEQTPPKIRDLLRRCLQKDAQRRLRDIGDARPEIEESLAAPAEPAASRALPKALLPRALVGGLACLFIGAVLAAIVLWILKPRQSPGPQSLARMFVTPPGEHLLGGEAGTPIAALSPDGARLVSVVREGSTVQLYLRRLDQLQFAAIAGTEGAVDPFFSPDGEWIGFYSVPEKKLEKVSVAGGAPQIVCETGQIDGASWGPHDIIVFSSGLRGNFGLYQIPAAGGTPRSLTTIDSTQGETGHGWPEFLPDGKSLLFSILHSGHANDDGEIVAQSLETDARKVLVRGGIQPHYAPSGHLIYARAGTLMAVPFDRSRLELTGTPVAVLEGLGSGDALSQFTFSKTGWLVYKPSGDTDSQLRRLVWVDHKGVSEQLAAPPRRYEFPRLSPESRRVAVQVVGDKTDIWIYDLARDTLTRLTSEGNNTWPIWTPDGNRVTFTSNRGGPDNLFWKLADGSGSDERLSTSEHVQIPRSWMPDGQDLVFEDVDPTTNDDLWVLPLHGNRQAWPFLRTPFPEGWARLSPDGHWLAYVSKELARTEVYVQPFPKGGAKYQISTSGATEPVWSHDGRELFFRSGDKMMAVDISTQPAFSAGKPAVLFESADYDRISTTPDYDVSLDGQRFLMIQAAGQQSAPPYVVVLNWFEELKRLAPTNE